MALALVKWRVFNLFNMENLNEEAEYYPLIVTSTDDGGLSYVGHYAFFRSLEDIIDDDPSVTHVLSEDGKIFEIVDCVACETQFVLRYSGNVGVICSK